MLVAYLLLVPLWAAFSFSLEDAIFDLKELAFSKDLTSLISESTIKSKCDGNIFIISSECEPFVDHALASIRIWAPPLIIIKQETFDLTTALQNNKAWNQYLTWQRRSCSLVFICDLIANPVDLDPGYVLTDNETNSLSLLKPVDAGAIHNYILLPKLFTSLDQVLYFTESESILSTNQGDLMLSARKNDGVSCQNSRTEVQESTLLSKAGKLLAIRAQFPTDTQELDTLMNVCSLCEFCSEEKRHVYQYLGDWQRNKTNFGKKYLGMLEETWSSFNNFMVRVGYFEYYPHFACPVQRHNFTSITFPKCLGIEWEILLDLAHLLHFKFNLTNVGELDDINGDVFPPKKTNFSNMLSMLKSDQIDIAVGGISSTPERLKEVDFTQVFEAEPILFVVQKPKNVFVLGIWLAFQPHVWPIIFLLIGMMSFLFQSIINGDFVCIPKSCKPRPSTKSMSHAIDTAFHGCKRKPLLVRIFYALEMSLQPMLGQAFNQSQILQTRRFKILLGLWWFSCLIITTFYNTSLISSLINPTITKEPETLQTLIDAGYRFKFGGRHAAVHDLINATSSDAYPVDLLRVSIQSLGRDTVDDGSKSQLLKSIRERLLFPEDTVFDPTTTAYIIEESALGSGISLEVSSMKIMKERLFVTGYSFALKPESHYRRKLDTALGHLNAGGLIQKYSARYIKKQTVPPQRKFRLRQRLGQINLNLKILQGAFIFLIFGLLFSTLAFCLEHWNKKYRFKLWSRQEVLQAGRKALVHFTQFYHAHVADTHASPVSPGGGLRGQGHRVQGSCRHGGENET